MPGRDVPPESHFSHFPYYNSNDAAIRRQVQRETIVLMRRENGQERARLRKLAMDNLTRWKLEADQRKGSADSNESKEALSDASAARRPTIAVVPDDWGVATLRATQQSGQCHAVLNLANAYHPGGGYLDGARAQEENMFRRTDCVEALEDAMMDLRKEMYTEQATRLISGQDGIVYLDPGNPRVCFRGPEDAGKRNLGTSRLQTISFFRSTNSVPLLWTSAEATNSTRTKCAREFDLSSRL